MSPTLPSPNYGSARQTVPHRDTITSPQSSESRTLRTQFGDRTRSTRITRFFAYEYRYLPPGSARRASDWHVDAGAPNAEAQDSSTQRWETSSKPTDRAPSDHRFQVDLRAARRGWPLPQQPTSAAPRPAAVRRHDAGSCDLIGRKCSKIDSLLALFDTGPPLVCRYPAGFVGFGNTGELDARGL